MEIKSGTLISAISKILKANFPDYRIYKEKKLQGLIKPCFFIYQINTEQEKVNKDIFHRELLINIRFHSDFTRIEIDDVGINLLDILSEIKQDQLILRPSKKMNYEIIDDVLQLFVNYKIRLYKEQSNKNTMKNLEINKGVIK